MAGTIMPAPWFTGLNDNGDPIVGGRLYTYAAGTTTLIPSYTDVNLTVAHENPIILDGAGRASVYLLPVSYKLVLKDADDVTIRTQDNISGIGAGAAATLDIAGVAGETIGAGQVVYLSDGSGGKIPGRWYLADADFPYASSLPLVGMAQTNIPSSTTGQVRLIGRVDVPFTVTPGATYWVSDVPGGLAAAAGTNVRVVGVADSSTSIVIAPNPPPAATGGGPPPYAYTYEIIPVADAASPVIDCAASHMDGTKIFAVSTSADRVLATPLNPQSGMRIVIMHHANGGVARTLSLPASAFRFGSDITNLTPTVAGKIDHIACIYDGWSGAVWDVVGYVKGY